MNECRLNANNLTLAKSKTEFMLIGSRQRLQTFNTPPSLLIDNAPIKLHLLNLLGVYVDENLSWNVHVDKIASGIGILKRSGLFVTFEVLSTISSALMQPHFDSL